MQGIIVEKVLLRQKDRTSYTGQNGLITTILVT